MLDWAAFLMWSACKHRGKKILSRYHLNLKMCLASVVAHGGLIPSDRLISEKIQYSCHFFFTTLSRYYLFFPLGPVRGPPTSGPPPISAPQQYNQYSHSPGDMQNGPPQMIQAPSR